MKKKIDILIPYFGRLPKNIVTFLISCKRNPTINWLIFTNDSIYKKLQYFCNNVIFIKSSLNWMKQRIKEVTGINDIVLDKPYKMCDYKPLYGKIFSKYIKGCDYWGYSDLDIVYGNLWPYIKYGVMNNYNKIGSRGHLTLIHNSHFGDNIYKLPIYKDNKKIYLFKDFVCRSNKIYDFDEMSGLNVICRQNNIKVYNNLHLVNDINSANLDINTLDKDKFWTRHCCYIWNNGRAEFFYMMHGKLKEMDYGYFHFQKRYAFKHYIHKDVKMFSITTYGYHKITILNIQAIKAAMLHNKSSFLKRLKYRIHLNLFTDKYATRMHIGKIHLPFKHVLMNIIHGNIKSLKI